MSGNPATQWDSWIGRKECRSDQLDHALARRWLATLDKSANDDGVMPQGIHFCLCTPETPNAALGADGHPARSDKPDSFFPPIPLPRRMWAASTIEFMTPLLTGSAIERTSRIVSISEKQGSSGPLAFVEVEHITSANGVAAIREIQSLVYRAAADPGAPLSPPAPGPENFDRAPWDFCRSWMPDETMLFRFSALTFNTHRIHYDAPYASDTERYRGLVVHGPLIATQLLGLAADQFGANCVKTFAFRAISPAIAGETLNLALRRSADAVELGCFAGDGRQTLTASATLA